MRPSEKYQPAVPKGKPTGIPTTYIVVALAIPLVVYFGFSAAQRALEVQTLNQEAAQVRAEIEALKDENAELRKQIEYARSDAFVEKVAREELNLVKPGDKAVVVLAGEGRGVGGSSAASAAETIDNRPNWLKWWHFFFEERR